MNLQDLIDSLEESGAFEKAGQIQQANLESDSEWSTERATHIGTLLQAWSYGVLSSYAYFHNYRLPGHFDQVFAHIADKLVLRFRLDTFEIEVVPISLCQIRQWFHQWAMELSEFRAWNDLSGSGVVTRDTPIATGPEFIDLNVPSHNAALFVRNQRRHEDAFDRRFEKDYGEEDG